MDGLVVSRGEGKGLVVDIALQTFINAILISSSTLLLALGLSLIFGVLGVVNFAHGAIFTMGAFFCYLFFVELGLPYVVAIVIAMVTGFLLGFIVEKVIFFPLRNEVIGGVIAAFGLSFVIEVSLGQSFGLDLRALPPVVPGAVRFGTVSIEIQRLFIVGGAIILTAMLIIFIHRSRIGRAIRATAQNMELSSLVGINIPFIRWVTFGIGSCLAMVAGVLVSPTTYLDPYVGGGILLQAFAAIILGGMGSIYGAVVGSVVVGFLLAIGLFFATKWAFCILFAAVVIILIIRPKGIIPFESA